MATTLNLPFGGIGLPMGRVLARAAWLGRMARVLARGGFSRRPRPGVRLSGIDLLLWLSRETRGS